MAETEVKTVEIDDKKYPGALKEALKNLVASSGPKKLYYKGAWDEFFPPAGEARPDWGGKNCLAVVGSRHLTYYGRKVTDQIVTEAAAAGITIVSGFMYGGDEAAHSAAVKCGGRTIAVMPCGIDEIFPPQQKELYNKILENNGLIISEYEGNFKPTVYSFVQRDRIVAGLSKAVFVTEAALGSGSLITANYAKKFGRKIFALPGQITSQVSQGTIKLIREGAEAVSCSNDILSFYKVLVSQRKLASLSLRGAAKGGDVAIQKPVTLEQKILDQLGREPLKADEMARLFAVPVSQLGTALSLMQLKGFITSDNGKYYLN